MDTTTHFVSIDSTEDLSAVDLRLSLNTTDVGIVATHTDPPPDAAAMPAVAAGHTRYWWRVLVGPGAELDPTGLAQPVTAYGTLDDDPEQRTWQWVLGDPEPDRLPQIATACWPVVIPSTLTTEWDAYPADIQELAKSSAVSELRRLTAGVVGGCPVIARPCRAGCPPNTWVGSGYGWRPALVSGAWLNIGCCSSSGACFCNVQTVRLPPPVGGVEAVWVDGAELPSSSWRLIGNDLLRTDGLLWPTNQDLSKPHTQAGTFAVVYLHAYAVDGAGALAAGLLAGEFAKSLTGKPCRIPANATRVNRGGTTVELSKRKGSDSKAFPDGITGIREVDAWVQRINPHGLRVPSTVWSPDIPAGASRA